MALWVPPPPSQALFLPKATPNQPVQISKESTAIVPPLSNSSGALWWAFIFPVLKWTFSIIYNSLVKWGIFSAQLLRDKKTYQRPSLHYGQVSPRTSAVCFSWLQACPDTTAAAAVLYLSKLFSLLFLSALCNSPQQTYCAILQNLDETINISVAWTRMSGYRTFAINARDISEESADKWGQRQVCTLHTFPS